MKQVNIIRNNSYEILEQRVNDWLKENDCNVMDIKYSSTMGTNHLGGMNYLIKEYTAMIIFMEN